jgi:hypothetical protein
MSDTRVLRFGHGIGMAKALRKGGICFGVLHLQGFGNVRFQFTCAGVFALEGVPLGLSGRNLLLFLLLFVVL